ncbi:MAG: hypothetical protein QF492_01015 [Candidatus Krumholzibacteria bacterium]|jgi:hypothetical protein|nr:hypothetical protein [Candidatus Krumholzibacteria bacterium]MDP6668473.1 hypothetical protein [Candidatus Krumholzibacteria bacterium]MDP6797367.1 hypothetical protein [Candidatus Krumholzibacteria bacterium]MDP7021566.1 hypothetical protein [Candidatus Krumholzibacteria bacterium]
MKAFLVLILMAAPLFASEEEPYYLYHAQDYGSESLIHPTQMLLNGCFDIMLSSNRSNRFADIDFQLSYDMLIMSLKHPIAAIEETEGWGNFIRKEILPFSTGLEDARFWPNYMLHVVGGGYSSRLMYEWYRYHEFKHPRAWSLGTYFLYVFVNEVVEAQVYDGYTSDPISDLYFFDPLGAFIFSSDRVASFFGETLNMRDWSYQPSLNFRQGSLQNNGQNFSMKWKPSFWEKTSFFYYFGHHGEGGLSWELPNGDYFSCGAGFRADEILELLNGTYGLTMAFSAGVFYDRNGSLLASLMASNTKNYTVQFNLYPGVLKLGPISPGLFFAVDRLDGHIETGIHLHWPKWQPAGISFGF